MHYPLHQLAILLVLGKMLPKFVILTSSPFPSSSICKALKENLTTHGFINVPAFTTLFFDANVIVYTC